MRKGLSARTRGALRSAGPLLAAAALATCGGGDGNHPPQLVAIDDQTVAAGQPLQLTLDATDADGDALTFEATDLPRGATFQSGASRAVFRWTPILADAGPMGEGLDYPVSFTVSDGHGGSDSERIIIRVTAGGVGRAPEFVSPSDFLIDLRAGSKVEFTVEVRDEDSTDVALTVASDGGLKGYQLEPLGQKSARFSWTPKADDTGNVFVLKFAADDGENPPVTQTVTVRLRRKSDCPGTIPKIAHTPLSDRRSGGSVTVSATVTDAESRVVGGTVFWTTKDPERATDADFTSVRLESGGGNTLEASFELPAPTADTPYTVSYTVCAQDDDDASGATCDHLTCVPDRGRFRFVVGSGAGGSCVDDDFEPNDGPDEASPAEAEYANLRTCGDDADWFAVDVPDGGGQLEIIAFYSSAGDDPDLVLVDPDGNELAQAIPMAGELLLDFAAETGGTYHVRVGGNGVDASYDLFVEVSAAAGACEPDSHEPNDEVGAAAPLFLGTVTGSICPSGDIDYFDIIVSQNDRITATLTSPILSGDLDLSLFGTDGAFPLAFADVGLGSETLTYIAPTAGFYYLVVQGFRGDTNSYSLEVQTEPVVIAPCDPDSSEPNESPAAAKPLPVGTTAGLTLCTTDADWFRFSAAASTDYAVTLQIEAGGGDLDLTVFPDAQTDGTPVGRSTGTGNTEVVPVPAAPAGHTYYVQVTGYRGATGTYSLEIGPASQR